MKGEGPARGRASGEALSSAGAGESSASSKLLPPNGVEVLPARRWKARLRGRVGRLPSAGSGISRRELRQVRSDPPKMPGLQRQVVLQKRCYFAWQVSRVCQIEYLDGRSGGHGCHFSTRIKSSPESIVLEGRQFRYPESENRCTFPLRISRSDPDATWGAANRARFSVTSWRRCGRRRIGAVCREHVAWNVRRPPEPGRRRRFLVRIVFQETCSVCFTLHRRGFVTPPHDVTLVGAPTSLAGTGRQNR